MSQHIEDHPQNKRKLGVKDNPCYIRTNSPASGKEKIETVIKSMTFGKKKSITFICLLSLKVSNLVFHNPKTILR